MSSAVPRLQKKWDTNSGPRSDVACARTPCLENTCMTKSEGNCAEVMVSYVRMNIPCLERRSTITRIEVKPNEGGRCSITSIETEFHGCVGIGSGLRNP